MKRELPRKKTIVNIVWFKRDLRSSDHAPLNEAALGEYPVLPIYVFEPDYWMQDDAAYRHWEFTKQSLELLREDLSTLGQALVFRKGKILDVFEDLKKDFSINAIYSHQETGNAWTYDRDKSVRYWGRVNGVKILEYQNNAIKKQDVIIKKYGTMDAYYDAAPIVCKDTKDKLENHVIVINLS